jgi:myo-inositol-1(or 4)-monophosphatase
MFRRGTGCPDWSRARHRNNGNQSIKSASLVRIIMKETLVRCVREAGALLLQHFGKVRHISVKENQSSIVTEADVASEKLIAEIICARHPEHDLLGEESGLQSHGSDITWVIDPLDGTSNFAAGLPWFGVMIAVLENAQPVMSAMYLPVDNVLYLAERGHGVTRNGQQIRMTSATDLRETLVAYGMDATADAGLSERQTQLLRLLVNRARNVRLTNCLLDVCYTLDGRFGAFVNQGCKIWDIAPACLMFPEQGGVMTDLQGHPIRLDLNPASYLRNYPAIGAKPALHRAVLEAARESGF